MKKILTLMLICTLFISIFTGCKQENTANIVAKNLDNNLNKLEVAVNKLDSVDNKYLSNPDIYSSLTATPNENNGKFFALAFNEIQQNTTNNVENVKQVLIDKITDKLLQQNSDLNSNNCYTCKKYCDENGNCYYTDCNGNNYCYGSSGECYDCDTIPNNCSYVGETTLTCPNAITTISETTNNELTTTNLTQTIETEEIDNTSLVNNNSESSPSIENDTTENQEVTTPAKPNVKVYYFTQDSFSPIKLKYRPRYISQYNEGNINDQIETYLFKVQKLYAMSEDSIEANSILQNCKINIIDCIKEIKELNNCIINGTCEPSVQELQALNNYIIDIKTTTNRLKDCNGELSKEINKISETTSNVMINSVDVMNSNYMRLLNHIDTRVTYHKSAIATLEQIRYLLDGAINGNSISEEEIENIIEDLQIQENPSDDVENNEVVEEVIIEDNTNTEEILPENNLEDNINNNEVSDNIENNEDITTSTDNNSIEENNSNLVDENNITNENIDNNEVNEESENVDTNTAEEANEDNTVVNNENTYTDEVVEENTQNNTLLDTYKETNSWSNIDTYKPVEDVETSTNVENEAIDNSEDNQTINENIDENFKENTEIVDESANIDNTNDTMINNTIDNGLNSGINPTINGGVNNNSGVYKNSVITQNNLDTNNGYGGYYYTNDGEIKNNGMNNDNEIGNNGNTIENNLNRKNNVNTYGYNTMLDILNQGTVNNGINTL